MEDMRHGLSTAMAYLRVFLHDRGT